MAGGDRTRSELIEEVWPDKVLYAATLLFITAILGVLHGTAFAVFDLTFGEGLPGVLTAMPAPAVLALSILEAIGAGLALRRQETRWTLAAGVVGVLSLSLFGLGSLLALVALVFVALARAEGEDASSPRERVPAETWPDKAFAASTVLVVGGVLTAGWGLANALEMLTFPGYMPQVAFGWLCLVLGLLALVAARLVYGQRGAWLGVLAGLGLVAGLAVYVVGPVLGLATVALIHQARQEDEFTTGTQTGRRAEAG